MDSLLEFLESQLGPIVWDIRISLEQARFLARGNDIDHPEALASEVFIGNHLAESDLYKEIFRTKRLGKVAYDDQGNRLEGFFPAFVSRVEFEAHWESLALHPERLADEVSLGMYAEEGISGRFKTLRFGNEAFLGGCYRAVFVKSDEYALQFPPFS